MERRFLLDVVVRHSAVILELLAGKDESLLIRRDALLVLNLRLYARDRVRRFHLEGDGLPGEGFHEDLHLIG